MNDYISVSFFHGLIQVSANFVRLYTNGVLVGVKPLSSALNRDSHSNGPTIVSFSSTHGESAVSNEIHGYVHGVEILSQKSPVKNHYLKVHARNNLTSLSFPL